MREIPRLTDEALRAFADGVVDGSVFIAHQVPEADAELLLPIIFPSRDPLTSPIEIGTMYGFTQQAEGHVHGYPIFRETRLLHVDDWRKAYAMIAEARAGLETARTMDAHQGHEHEPENEEPARVPATFDLSFLSFMSEP